MNRQRCICVCVCVRISWPQRGLTHAKLQAVRPVMFWPAHESLSAGQSWQPRMASVHAATRMQACTRLGSSFTRHDRSRAGRRRLQVGASGRKWVRVCMLRC